MRVLVTGASGRIGSAVVPELLAAGHEVVGVARSDASAAALRAAGAHVHRGDLRDPDGLAAAAAAADGVVHLAFDHESMRAGAHADAAAGDLRVTAALGAALEGSGKPFVTTAGTLALALAAPGRTATERDVLASGPRIEAENLTISLADRGVRSSVVRLPPIVHSDLDHHGFAPALIAMARDHGASGHVGDGANRWPAVDTRDAARLYRLALESAPAGSRLHPIGDEGVPFHEIAAAIGAGLGLPTDSVAPEDAAARFSYLGAFVQLDNPVSCELTRELLGWRPENPGLLADLRAGHYLADGSRSDTR